MASNDHDSDRPGSTSSSMSTKKKGGGGLYILCHTLKAALRLSGALIYYEC